ncbi:hypothetical protein GYMLUDRAFT_45508 [Collybiopsis luxurians FD-317 M1]|uniref:Peptidase C45 hydrolase domain-containing protein n=1 Tax=Collybiopsis luxurians FD-317 M1 TaxID=944289 RepID=A0A0D0BSG1_9AGAR|nr:hypothetical protein GYMLUDRAFT_45508 [Collybiopsis luxurians FD-317 M1]
MSPVYPRLHLEGTSYEIGVAHGTHLSSQIRSQIQIYAEMFQQTSKLSWSEVHSVARQFQNSLSKLLPEIYEEMTGIAKGADVDILDIIALNARSEIALGLYSEVSDGCTALGWKHYPSSERDEVILAQNWDWTPRVQQNLAMMSISQPGKPQIYMITEAGVVGKIGFNSSSVGVCLNAIRAHPMDTNKLPIHIALRLCLESTSAQAAIEKLNTLGGVASAQHILIADPCGPLCLELSPLGNVVIHPHDDAVPGYIAHTNHFLQNKFVKEAKVWLPDSPIRLQRINQLAYDLTLSSGTRRVSSRDITNDALRAHIFSDTFNAPVSICRFGDMTRPETTRSTTLFCIVMRFSMNSDPWAEVVWGKPESGATEEVCRMPWFEVHL